MVKKISRFCSRARSSVNLHLAERPRLWAIRKFFQSIGFRAFRRLFVLQHRILEGNIRRRTFGALVWNCIGQILKALFIALLLVTLGQFLPSNIRSWLPELNGDTYTNLIATITAIGGIFIGLYYTAISVVAGTIYATVPNNIRDLLARERVGNVYMRSLALLTVLGLVLLFLDALDIRPLTLAVLFVGFWSGFTVFAFVNLGARAFDLFDPTALSSTLFLELTRNYKQVSVGGLGWNDMTYQLHAHRRAAATLDTVETLASITEEAPHLKGRPYVSFCKNLIAFLINYEEVKKRIPTKSRWYGLREVHSSWYRTPGHEVSLAHKSSTSLMPTSEGDTLWIEKRIHSIILRCLEVNVKDERRDLAIEALRLIHSYVGKLGQEGQLELAFSFVDEVFQLSDRVLLRGQDASNTNESDTRCAIVEHIASLPITILLAYCEALDNNSIDAIQRRLDRINWSRKSGIYKAGFRQQSLEKLEWLQERLSFENVVEGTVVSPNWYLDEIMRSDTSLINEQALHCLYEGAISIYSTWIKSALALKLPWLSAIMIAREYEYLNKLKSREKEIADNWNRFLERQTVEGLNWPQLAFEELQKKTDEEKLKLLRDMSVEANVLLKHTRTDSVPDFSGQFLHNVGEALIDAMYENKASHVECLFLPYLIASFEQFRKIRPESGIDISKRLFDLKISVAPLLDLMDLSGYAYLYAAYHGNHAMSDAVSEAWDTFRSCDGNQQIFALFKAAIELSEQPLEIAHRSEIRFHWKRIATQRLAGLEKRAVGPPHRYELVSDQCVLHNDPLVRIMANDRLPHVDGIEIFLHKYVRARSECTSVRFGFRRARDLAEAIKDEEQRFESLKKGNLNSE